MATERQKRQGNVEQYAAECDQLLDALKMEVEDKKDVQKEARWEGDLASLRNDLRDLLARFNGVCVVEGIMADNELRKSLDILLNFKGSTPGRKEVKALEEKPKCKLLGEDGNIFNLVGLARRALEKAGQRDKAKEMVDKVFDTATDYDHALRIIMEYVDVE